MATSAGASGRFWARWGRWVLIEAPGRLRVEVYREDPQRLEIFTGYLDEHPAPLRVRLLRAWVRAFVDYREHTPIGLAQLGFRHVR